MDWRQHITVDPAVCHGRPCLRGTRVLVSVVLDNLADGEPAQEVALAYRLRPEQVQATLAYAAELARDRYIDLPTGTG